MYQKGNDVPTVGAGHAVLPKDNLKVGDKITTEKAESFRAEDVKKAEASVRSILGSTQVSQNEFDALVDLTFNVGAGKVRNSPNLMSGIKKSDYKRTGENLTYTKGPDGKQMGGLVNRSRERAELFNSEE